MTNETSDKPRGWMSPLSAYLVAMLSDMQHRLGIFGTVGEIGVYHGLFFLALVHTAAKKERLFACDVFGGEEGLVLDNGAHKLAAFAYKSVFDNNIKHFGVNLDDVWMYRGNSLGLEIAALQEANLIPFRMVSVDGGHDAKEVVHDLCLAASVLTDGGLVVLDDFTNDRWMGVREGFYRFLGSDSGCKVNDDNKGTLQLAPFLLFCNKLYLTTPAYHKVILSAALQDYWINAVGTAVEPEATGSGNTRIAGWSVAVQAGDDLLCSGLHPHRAALARTWHALIK